MGRLLAVLAARPLAFAASLHSVRRSSPSLSEEHFDGWTSAVHGHDGLWVVRTGSARVGENAFLASVAGAPPGVAFVAHVRARAAAAVSSRATPCQRDRWMFAYEGTVEDLAYLESQTSAVRRAGRGEGHGDRLLAFLLTRLDENKLSVQGPPHAVDAVLAAAASELTRRIGSLSFVLSDGSVLYAHRFDRSLYLLERGQYDAVLVASEPITSEPWIKLEDRTLVACRRSKSLDVRFLFGRDPRVAPFSDVELPFTD